MTFLEEYRGKRATLLEERLTRIKARLIAKYGSLEKIRKTGNEPLESSVDMDILERLIKYKTFLVLPVLNDNDSITHVYTIGCWYYWGLPEIVLKFKKPLNINYNFINTITGIIHKIMFERYKNDIIITDDKTNDNINKLKYETDEEIEIENMSVHFILKKVEHAEYMDLNARYMMWFYSFWDIADVDSKGNPELYPVFSVELDDVDINNVIEGITSMYMAKMDLNDNSNDSDSNGDSDENSDSDENVDSDGDVEVDEKNMKIKVIPKNINNQSTNRKKDY